MSDEEEVIKCIHCNEPMKMWQTPSFGFAGSTGFGYPYLWVCFNDECPFYVQGYEHTLKTFGRRASYRFAAYPDNDCTIAIPVFTEAAGKGNIIEDPAEFFEHEGIAQAKLELYELKALGDYTKIIDFICDTCNPNTARIEATVYIGGTADLDMIEHLYACRIEEFDVAKAVTCAIAEIHKRFFTRDCPFCAEVIKNRAKICRYCGRELEDVKPE